MMMILTKKVFPVALNVRISEEHRQFLEKEYQANSASLGQIVRGILDREMKHRENEDK
jgi:hypothetical protein